ncbi:MAG: alpha/beta fold hydrolase, partial [Bacteroidota bacterium]
MPDSVLILHGLGRTSLSMAPLALGLRRAGFHTTLVDYPSRRHSVEELVEAVVAPRVEALGHHSERVHFVTHSLGGVLARAHAAMRYDAGHRGDDSRAVMIAPPHAGSEIADLLRQRQPFKSVLGPTLQELGTDPDSVPLG